MNAALLKQTREKMRDQKQNLAKAEGWADETYYLDSRFTYFWLDGFSRSSNWKAASLCCLHQWIWYCWTNLYVCFFLNTQARLSAGLFFSVLRVNAYLATSFDFQIVTSNIPGVSQIIPQNEDAYSYLVEETMFTVFKDGTTALFDERVGDFISDAGHAHLCCAMSWLMS